MSWLQKICSPILTDETGKPRTFYHGTDEEFDQFEHHPGKRYVLFSDFDVNTPGHFFSEEVETAQDFGRNVMERQLDVDRLLLDPTEYPHMSVDRFPPELEKELQYILAPMIREDGWLEVGVRATKVYPDDEEWIYNVVGNDGLMWDALDNPEVVARMKERGYDGTYVDEGEYNKRSIFVLENKQIIPVGKD